MNVRKSIIVAVPFLLLVTVYSLTIHAFFGITKATCFKFIISQCFVIMAPGMICVKMLLGNREKSVIHWMTLSYALGYAINLVEYIVIWSMHLQQFATEIIFVITVVVCLLWFYKPIEVDFVEISQDDYFMLFLFWLFLLINIISYSGNNISPIIGAGSSVIMRDIQFWCANAVSLKQSFLPESAYFSGTSFFYHYFSSLHIAFMSQVTGISVFDTACTLFSFGKCVLLIGGLNYLIDRYRFGNVKYIFCISVLFMTGWERKSFVTYCWHLIYNPFGFDIGFAFGLWFTAFMLDLFDDEKFDIRQFILIMLIWGTVCGTKGPIAALLIVIPGIACFTWLFQKKIKMAFGYGIPFLSIFGVINVVCVGIIRILNHTAEEEIEEIGGLRTIYEVLANTPFDLRYRNIIPAMIWAAFSIHPFLFCLTVINSALLLWMIFTKKTRISNCFKAWVLLFTAFIGFFLGRFYDAGGSSEMYFTMAAYIPCLAYNLEVYRELINREVMLIKWKDVQYKTILITLSMIGIYCWGFTEYRGGVITPLSIGYSRICGKVTASDDSGSFSRREAEACAWIRDNTPQNSIIQSNRFISFPTGSYFVEIFSERIQYMEATDLIYYCDLGIDEPHIESKETVRRGNIIAKAFNGDVESLEQLIDEGVDYLVQDDYLGENCLENSGLKVVYDKNDIVIYAVNQ